MLLCATFVVQADGLDGEYWVLFLSHNEKVAMVEGLTMGAGVAGFFLSPVCSKEVDQLRYPAISFAGLVTEVDGFYKTEANKPLPISIAVVYVLKRFWEDKDLDAFLTVMRKTAKEAK